MIAWISKSLGSLNSTWSLDITLETKIFTFWRRHTSCVHYQPLYWACTKLNGFFGRTSGFTTSMCLRSVRATWYLFLYAIKTTDDAIFAYFIQAYTHTLIASLPLRKTSRGKRNSVSDITYRRHRPCASDGKDDKWHCEAQITNATQ